MSLTGGSSKVFGWFMNLVSLSLLLLSLCLCLCHFFPTSFPLICLFLWTCMHLVSITDSNLIVIRSRVDDMVRDLGYLCSFLCGTESTWNYEERFTVFACASAFCGVVCAYRNLGCLFREYSSPSLLSSPLPSPSIFPSFKVRTFTKLTHIPSSQASNSSSKDTGTQQGS